MAETETKSPTLVEIDPEDIPVQTRAGKASHVVDGFMESNLGAARIEDAAKGFNVALRRYVKQNELPVAVVTRAGVHYLKRTDLGDEE